MPDLLIATSNGGKRREYEAFFADARERYGVQVLTLHDVGLGDMDVEEPFDTFEENARKKALEYGEASGVWTLADDSGLAIDALKGRPGVLSARYVPGTDRDRIDYVLGEMNTVEDAARTARFICVIALYDPSLNRLEMRRGTVEGHITRAPGKGTNGFGYDPIFIADGYSVPLSDLSMQAKSAVDHRGNAARLIVPVLETWAKL